MMPPIDFSQYVRATNSVGMMTFGLLGILLASLALRMAAPADREH